MSKVLGIIPACGFGTRMNIKPNKSKEMLTKRNVSGDCEPLIQFSIDQCIMNNIDPLVLVRKEKTDLIDYLDKTKVKYIIMEPGKEWAETVYNSNKYWKENNILILPDTRWKPLSVLKQITQRLEFGADAVFALHEVENISKWGEVDIIGYCEKPETVKEKQEGMAWGLIGFKQEIGYELFEDMQRKGETFSHCVWTQFIFLDNFKDLTRTGKIE